LSLNGVLNIDKPSGITSYETVVTIKQLTGVKRVGHAGTLDPLACGVLPICLGKATRIVEYLNELNKTYRAEVLLGKSTDTYDAEGKITDERDASFITEEQIESTMNRFRGEIAQKPPMYSALKHNGKRLYEIARKGITVYRKSRKVNIYGLELKGFNEGVVTIEVECGRGTYIRSLANDLGEALGCGAYLKSLVRTGYGPFTMKNSFSPSKVKDVFEEGRLEEIICPPDKALLHLPVVYVSSEDSWSLRNGKKVSLEVCSPKKEIIKEKPYRAYAKDGCFIGLVKADSGGDYLKPLKIF